MKEPLTEREKISLNFLCQIYNSKQFQNLFGKSQLYTVHNTSNVEELDDKIELEDLIDLVETDRVEVDELQSNDYRIDEGKLTQPKKFSELIAYSLTNISQEDFQIMATNFSEKIHSKVETTDRGVHSIDVAIINGLIARKLREPDISLTIAMGLVHDIGHTPFGHEVEEAIDQLITDVYKEHFPDKLEERQQEIDEQDRTTSEAEKRTQKNNLFFSHERNGSIKFEELMSLYEDKFFKELEGVGVPYSDKVRAQYEKMKIQIKSSILAHTTSRMSKKDLKREQLINGGVVEITRMSDKIAYTMSDLRDIFKKGNASPEEIQQDTSNIAKEYMAEYCKRKNKGISAQEIDIMLENFSSLSYTEQIMYMINHTHQGDDYVKMDPFVWRMAKAYRKTVSKIRSKLDFNKNTKAIFAVGYLNWESTFLSKYKEKAEDGEELSEEELRKIIDETNEVVCRRKDRDALIIARKRIDEMRGYSNQVGIGIDKLNSQEALRAVYNYKPKDEIER